MNTSLSPDKINELRNNARLAIADELDHERESQTPTELPIILRQIKAWHRWYLKRNQPNNYIRISRIIPPAELQDNPFFYRCKIQIWQGGKKEEIIDQYVIDSASFNYLKSLFECEIIKSGQMEYGIYRPQHKIRL